MGGGGFLNSLKPPWLTDNLSFLHLKSKIGPPPNVPTQFHGRSIWLCRLFCVAVRSTAAHRPHKYCSRKINCLFPTCPEITVVYGQYIWVPRRCSWCCCKGSASSRWCWISESGQSTIKAMNTLSADKLNSRYM